MDVAVKSLDFYREYFGISYPINKMDLIAISDFSAGAMENWGLVTYRYIYIYTTKVLVYKLIKMNWTVFEKLLYISLFANFTKTPKKALNFKLFLRLLRKRFNFVVL